MSEQENQSPSALRVQEGIPQPPSVNQEAVKKLKRRKIYPAKYYVDGILSGDRTVLSQAITLIESVLPSHQALAQDIIEQCLPHSGNSVRIGITGVPGVGKSSFIEVFGKYLTSKGYQLAVLAVDPSSERSKGSILGDKTRMELLSIDPNAFIRPSPSAGTLGGVARKTRETIILCEAAGFNVILVETVGVGQSETAVHNMVDFFLLLMLAGAGDELQGIKKGIMEMCDAIVITKADGDNILKARAAKREYANALHLMPPAPSGWKPQTEICSAKTRLGIDKIWQMIEQHREFCQNSGFFYQNRENQALIRMNETVRQYLEDSFNNHPVIQQLKPKLENDLKNHKISAYKAAQLLLEAYLGKS